MRGWPPETANFNNLPTFADFDNLPTFPTDCPGKLNAGPTAVRGEVWLALGIAVAEFHPRKNTVLTLMTV